MVWRDAGTTAFEGMMSPESTFFYMAAASVAIAPAAIGMTDWSRPVNWGFGGPVVVAAIHSIDSTGAVFALYALKNGKAIIVFPMTALAPVLTIMLALSIHQVLRIPPLPRPCY